MNTFAIVNISVKNILPVVILLGLAIVLQPSLAETPPAQPRTSYQAISETIPGDPPRVVWTFIHKKQDTYSITDGSLLTGGGVQLVISCENGLISDYLLTVPSESNVRFYRSQPSIVWRVHKDLQVVEEGEWTSLQFSQQTYESIFLVGSEGPSVSVLMNQPDNMTISAVLYPDTEIRRQFDISMGGIKDALTECAAN